MKVKELVDVLGEEKPSFDIYLQDENGDYLDIIEVKKVLFERGVVGSYIILVGD